MAVLFPRRCDFCPTPKACRAQLGGDGAQAGGGIRRERVGQGVGQGAECCGGQGGSGDRDCHGWKQPHAGRA